MVEMSQYDEHTAALGRLCAQLIQESIDRLVAGRRPTAEDVKDATRRVEAAKLAYPLASPGGPIGIPEEKLIY